MPVITPDEARLDEGPTADEFMPPEGCIHYETKPITTRMVERGGLLWAVTWYGKWDGTGFKVERAEVSLYEEHRPLRPGDLVEIRCKVIEDQGSDVQYRIESPDYSQSFWAKRSAIARILRAGP